jgi:hypothetical protein
VTINVGGGLTDDKPDVVLEPPGDLTRASAFLNLRVADIQAVYQDWSAKGAEFLTPPKDHGREIRCYMRDPDGHLIEVRRPAPCPTADRSRRGTGSGGMAPSCCRMPNRCHRSGTAPRPYCQSGLTAGGMFWLRRNRLVGS